MLCITGDKNSNGVGMTCPNLMASQKVELDVHWSNWD